MEQYVGAKALRLTTGDKYFDNVADEALELYAGLMMYANDARTTMQSKLLKLNKVYLMVK